MRVQSKIFLGFALSMMIALAVSAQSLRRPAMPGEVGVSMALQIAGQPFRFEGPAQCTHAPVAFIYDVAAEMWSVEQFDGQRALRLVVWRPKNGSGNMFYLNVTTGGKSYSVNTVKTGAPITSLQGSGVVTFTSSGAGGTFTINATAASGAPITGTITSNGFAGAIAEGG